MAVAEFESTMSEVLPYIGRLAPSPTGLLHAGHAATFRTAFERAQAAGGMLLLRNEDLDPHRCRPEFVARQILLGSAWLAHTGFHAPPAVDGTRRRPAKRKDALSIRALREWDGRPPRFSPSPLSGDQRHSR